MGDFSRTYDLRINVRKPIESFGYSVIPPEDSVGISYVGNNPIVASEYLDLVDRSESVNPNSRYFFSSLGEEKFTTETSYTTESSDIDGTNVFLPVPDPLYSEKPAWYVHVLPTNTVAAKLNRAVADGGLVPVSVFNYSVSLQSYKLFTSLQNTYDEKTGKFEVFFVDITLSDGTFLRELLSGDSVFHEATIDDLDLTTGEINEDSGAYTKTQNGSTYTYSFPKAGKKVIREKSRARIAPFINSSLSLNDPWNLSISNGKFSRLYNNFLYDYSINEFTEQVFTPFYPYGLQNSESGEVIANQLIKVSKDVKFNNLNGLHIDVVVKNQRGVVKSALSSRSDAVNRTDYDWTVSTNFSVDSELGLIYNFDLDCSVGDTVEITYFYKVNEYEFTEIELNPYRNDTVEEYMWVVYLVPNMLSGYNSLYYLQVDKNNLIVSANQQVGEHSSFPVDFPNFSKTTSSGGVNTGTVVGTYYRNYGTAESGDSFWVDTYSSEGSNSYQYQILAEIVFRNNYDKTSYRNLDIRVLGGGIKASSKQTGLQTVPAFQYASPEFITERGIAYPGNFASVVRIPYTMLTEYGGSFTRKEVEDNLYIHAPSGSYFILELTGVIPRICSIKPGDTSGTIKVSWVIEAPEYQYNVYVSKSWNGPFKSNSAGTLYNDSPISLSSYSVGSCADPYTIAGLNEGQAYKVAITAVDSVTGIESPPSIVYEVVAGTDSRTLPDVVE